MAIDNGDPAQTTSVTVQININDINEFDPQFSQSLYTVSGLALNDTQPGVQCVVVVIEMCVVCACVCVDAYSAHTCTDSACMWSVCVCIYTLYVCVLIAMCMCTCYT